MKKIDFYILKKFLGTYFFIVGLIVCIVIVFDLVEKMDDFLDTHAPVKSIIFDYYMNLVPYYANMLSPLLVFIAVIFFTSKMAGQSEIIAILASGVSFRRMLYPYFLGATIIAIMSYFLGSQVIPLANRTRIDFENIYVKTRKETGLSDMHMQVSPGVFVYLGRYYSFRETGDRFNIEKYEEKRLVSRLYAKTITYDSISNRWKLNNYTQWNFDKDGISHKISQGTEIDSTINILPSDFKKERKSFEMLTSSELNDHITQLRERNIGNTEEFEIELRKRQATPFAAYILALIGVSLASRKTRGGMGLHIGIGLVLSFIFILFLTVSSTFAVNGGMNAILAVWLPNIVFGIIGIFLYRNAPK
ncbi:MAG: YjgP/YjgQ family permease [Marinilabiliaceae bacterium]|nr:YjgP/YjgQ family permease [Marinilabiliaceae bacterium]